MAMLKFGHAAVHTPVVCPGKWLAKKVPLYKEASVKKIVATYDPSQWLLSHVTIMASVDTDLADPKDKKSNYLIKPEYSVFVNNNGDSWERNLLKVASKTFLGADNYCFPSGTRVLMSDGTYKPIEQVKKGDVVINRKGEKAFVTNAFSRMADNLVSISSKGLLSRNIYTTPEHPFWVFHARETCPKTGRPNFFNPGKDFCLLDKWTGFSVGVHKKVGEEFPSGLSPQWTESSKIDPNRDFLTHPVSSVEICNEEVNENRAELIGWFLAEGYYDNKNEFSEEESGITFALGNDETDVASRLSELMVKEFGEKFRIDCKPRLYESQSGSYMLSISNAEVAKFFKKWCGKYSWAKKLHEDAIWLPKNLQAIILRNVIYGDGCGTVESRGYSLEMKSQALIQQLHCICLRLGILPMYREVGVLPRYSDCSVVDGYEVYVDPITGKKSRPGYLLRLSTRDSKKLNEICGIEDRVMLARESKKYTHIFNEGDYCWAVSKIEDVKQTAISSQVYNIEVEGDNSYVVEGVVVHNCEHVQIPELSKGKVIDVALRDVPFTKDMYGNDLTTLYVDILIATNRKHVDLIEKISSGEYNATSMGCLIKFSYCSQCGNKAEDESQACKHVRFFKNNYFYDPNGVKRIIAELCGDVDDPESCKFIDASWVRKPAFEGAVKRNLIEPPEDVADKIQRATLVPSFKAESGMCLRAASVIARDVIKELEAQDEPPKKEEPPAAAPESDLDFPEAPKDKEVPLKKDVPEEPPAEAPPAEAPAEEAPPAEAPAEEEAPLEGAPPAGMPGTPGDPGAAPSQPAVAEPAGDATVKEVKDMLKKQLLNQIRRDLLKDEATEQSNQRPLGVETDSNRSLVKEASITKVLAASKRYNDDRLYNGIMILSSLKNWDKFKKYGYSRNDVLGILHHIDNTLSDDPIQRDMVKAMSMVKTSSDSTKYFTEIILETGRKPTKKEAVKMVKWSKILRNFEGL